MVVLQARGLLVQPEATPFIEQARNLALSSGDVLARFSLESNLAAAHLDAGDVERAGALMSVVGELADQGDMDINRFIQTNNEAELHLAREDYALASESFSAAASFLSVNTPRYMRDLVLAGLGLCALEMGDLARARECEMSLSRPPDSWYFDPTTLVAFRSRLLELRGLREEALALLAATAEDLRRRLTTAWLKVLLLRTGMLSKVARQEARELAEALGQEARALRLPHRARDFDALVNRLG